MASMILVCTNLVGIGLLVNFIFFLNDLDEVVCFARIILEFFLEQ